MTLIELLYHCAEHFRTGKDWDAYIYPRLVDMGVDPDVISAIRGTLRTDGTLVGAEGEVFEITPVLLGKPKFVPIE